MNEIKPIKQARREVYKNHFLRDVSYLFNIEASSLFASKLLELKELGQSLGLKIKEYSTGEDSFILGTKQNSYVLMSSRLLTIRADAAEYKNFDIFSSVITPFVSAYADVLDVSSINAVVIIKNNDFILHRDNDLAKKISLEQYCNSLFSEKFRSQHTPSGVTKLARNVNVSAKYTSTLSDAEYKVELLVGCVDNNFCEVKSLGKRLVNANNAIFDMWSFAISKELKDILNKENES